MSPLTTHVLDVARGRPAAGIGLRLEQRAPDGAFTARGRGVTDSDGRVKDLLAPGMLMSGCYRLTFEVGAYFAMLGVSSFYQEIPIEFTVEDAAQHYHVPLLLSPFGYSTYRGS